LPRLRTPLPRTAFTRTARAACLPPPRARTPPALPHRTTAPACTAPLSRRPFAPALPHRTARTCTPACLPRCLLRAYHLPACTCRLCRAYAHCTTHLPARLCVRVRTGSVHHTCTFWVHRLHTAPAPHYLAFLHTCTAPHLRSGSASLAAIHLTLTITCTAYRYILYCTTRLYSLPAPPRMIHLSTFSHLLLRLAILTPVTPLTRCFVSLTPRALSGSTTGRASRAAFTLASLSFSPSLSDKQAPTSLSGLAWYTMNIHKRV